MKITTIGDRSYEIDQLGFLLDFEKWDESFAQGTAAVVGIAGELSQSHWIILTYIRGQFKRTGRCPTVFHTCRASGLRLEQLRELFPTGYLRGACRLAGITYEEGFCGVGLPAELVVRRPAFVEVKTYEIDAAGFLVNPASWDARFATLKAEEMKMPEGLTRRHWDIIRFLRARWTKDRILPNVYETCEAGHITLDELERLFPDGYQRGAVKIAGLRVTDRETTETAGNE